MQNNMDKKQLNEDNTYFDIFDIFEKNNNLCSEVVKAQIDSSVNNHMTDYSWFKKAFFEENPEATEEDLWNIVKRKKGIYYIDFNNAEDFNIPNREYCGELLPVKRKITGQKILGTLYVTKDKNHIKEYKYYEKLQASQIGLIPIKGEKYVFMCKKNITVFTIIFPIVFIRLFLYTFFKI